MDLSQQIEGLLFYKANPVKKTSLPKLFDVDGATITTALETLKTRLEGGAIVLSESDTEVQLVTAAALDELIESVRKDEMKRDIGKAGAETLAIILYKGPISRVEIDRIRGVNSAFIIRNLLIRGLVERELSKNTAVFTATTMLLSHLGITNKTELPEYPVILDQLEKFEAEQESSETSL